MKKRELLSYINDYIKTIEISPELFHDGIDEEIIEVLKEAKKYIEEN